MKWLAIFLLIAPSAFGVTCRAVTPSGSGTGLSWSSPMALPANPTSNIRYYLADGNYNFIDYTATGTTTEIRKAQSYDFGRASDGCTNDISAGWNAATMGSAQAVFGRGTNFFGHFWFIEAGFITFNGNGQQTSPGCGGAVGNDPTAAPVTPTDCGIKIDNSVSCGTDPVSNPASGGYGFKLAYVELLGCGDASNEDFMVRADTTSNTVLTHMYMHHFGSVCVVVGGADHLTASLNYYFRNQTTVGTNPTHGQCFQSGGDNGNITVNSSVFRDLGGTAIIMSWVGTGVVESGPYNFYDNTIWTTPGFTPNFPSANGTLACINGFTCNNVTLSQNTFVNMTNQEIGIDSETGGTFKVQNNLFYQDSQGFVDCLACGGTFTEDHNSYLTSGASCPAGTANVCNNTASVPFVNWQGGNFNLLADTSNVNNRVSLASPFTVDQAGVTFTTDRGALQFASGGPALSLSPGLLSFGNQNLNTTSASQTLTLSNPGSASATISSISTSGTNASEFTVSNTDCGTLPATLAAAASCHLAVTFTPTATGNRGASVVVHDAVNGEPDANAAVSGTGFDPTAINVVQAVACGPQTFPGNCTITSTTAGNVLVMSFGSYNSAGAACPGGVTGCAMTSVTDSATGGSDTFTEVPNTKAINTATDATGTQTSWNDMWWATTHGGATTVTVTPNTTGTGDVFIWEISNVNSVNASGNLSSQAATTLPVSPSLTTNVAKAAIVAHLHPSGGCGGSTGIHSGNQFISDSLNDNMAWAHELVTTTGSFQAQWDTASCVFASNAAAFVSSAGSPVVVFSPPSLNFGSLPVGNTSVAQVITLSNTGAATLNITSIIVPSGYSQSNNCGAPIAPNSSCNITITFKPRGIGANNGSLQVSDNASGSPQSAALSGSGKPASFFRANAVQGAVLQ